jgi:hypothetical protein
MRPSAVSMTLFVASLALLSGCGGSSESPQPDADTSAPPPAATSSVPASEAATPAVASPAAESSGPPPTSGPVHRLGDRVRLVTGSRMTVFTWQRVRRPGAPAAGAWWAADVEFCLTRTFGDNFQEPIGNIRSQLVAELPDGRALTPEADARTSDEVYAQSIPVVAGRCVRGELVFDVPAGDGAAYLAVTFSPFSWVRWQLS